MQFVKPTFPGVVSRNGFVWNYGKAHWMVNHHFPCRIAITSGGILPDIPKYIQLPLCRGSPFLAEWQARLICWRRSCRAVECLGSPGAQGWRIWISWNVKPWRICMTNTCCPKFQVFLALPPSWSSFHQFELHVSEISSIQNSRVHLHVLFFPICFISQKLGSKRFNSSESAFHFCIAWRKSK